MHSLFQGGCGLSKSCRTQTAEILYAQTAEIFTCDSVFHGVESTNSFIGERISEELPREFASERGLLRGKSRKGTDSGIHRIRFKRGQYGG